MAVHYSQLESKPCQIIGGFENGSLINWDIRNPHHHLSGVQLYDEPSMMLYFVCVLRHFYSATSTTDAPTIFRHLWF